MGERQAARSKWGSGGRPRGAARKAQAVSCRGAERPGTQAACRVLFWGHEARVDERALGGGWRGPDGSYENCGFRKPGSMGVRIQAPPSISASFLDQSHRLTGGASFPAGLQPHSRLPIPGCRSSHCCAAEIETSLIHAPSSAGTILCSCRL